MKITKPVIGQKEEHPPHRSGADDDAPDLPLAEDEKNIQEHQGRSQEHVHPDISGANIKQFFHLKSPRLLRSLSNGHSPTLFCKNQDDRRQKKTDEHSSSVFL